MLVQQAHGHFVVQVILSEINISRDSSRYIQFANIISQLYLVARYLALLIYSSTIKTLSKHFNSNAMFLKPMRDSQNNVVLLTEPISNMNMINECSITAK